jgi:hypothetical protein
MPLAIPLAGVILAAFLEWAKWGLGRFNWGPKIGSLFIIGFGYVAFAHTRVGEWVRSGIEWLAHWAGVGVSYVLGSGAGDAFAYLLHWLPAALLGAYYLAAMSPWWFKERMTWHLAWLSIFLPMFVPAIPGPAGNFFDWVFGLFAWAGGAIIGAIFGMAHSAYRGLGGA